MINPAFIPDDFFKVLAPSDIFGADGPFEVDLGCGDGGFLTGAFAALSLSGTGSGHGRRCCRGLVFGEIRTGNERNFLRKE